jgi:hypothetical protein
MGILTMPAKARRETNKSAVDELVRELEEYQASAWGLNGAAYAVG